MRRMSVRPLSLTAASALALAATFPCGAQTVRSGAGTGPTDPALLAARDDFRTDLGGGTSAGAAGSFGGVRREINWDGVAAGASAPNNLPANFFNTTSPRGAVFSTAGSGFQVSGATTDAGAGQPAAANFGNVNPAYTTTFQTFTPQRLFTALDSNVLDVNFFLAGTTTPAVTRGFGAVFSDVDLPNTTSVQLFDASNTSLGTFFAPAAGSGLSFVGVSYPDAMISRVRITNGNAAPGAAINDTNGNPTDLVVMDDFIYGEPVPEPASLGTLAGVSALLLVRRVRRG